MSAYLYFHILIMPSYFQCLLREKKKLKTHISKLIPNFGLKISKLAYAKIYSDILNLF
jgi:hypothetical protein